MTGAAPELFLHPSVVVSQCLGLSWGLPRPEYRHEGVRRGRGAARRGAVGSGLHEQVVLMLWLILKVQGSTSLPKSPRRAGRRVGPKCVYWSRFKGSAKLSCLVLHVPSPEGTPKGHTPLTGEVGHWVPWGDRVETPEGPIPTTTSGHRNLPVSSLGPAQSSAGSS